MPYAPKFNHILSSKFLSFAGVLSYLLFFLCACCGIRGLLVRIRSERMKIRFSFCSAPPPPIAAATLLRGVVTMRCDICTATFARVPLLVSGAAQTCFDDQVRTS